MSRVSSGLAVNVVSRDSGKSKGGDSTENRGDIEQGGGALTGELVNLSDIEAIKLRGEYLKVANTKKRLSVEDFDRRVEIDSWKLLTLITDQSSSSEAIEFLQDGIARIPDLSMTFESSRNFLIYSVLKADRELIGKILEMKPQLLDEPDLFGRAAIHYAILLKRLKVITFLIENGASLKTKDIYGQNPLHLAAQKFDQEIYLYLRFKGVDGLEVDNYGLRPIDYIDSEEKFNLISAFEIGSPRKPFSRKTSDLYIECPNATVSIDSVVKISTTFSNPGKSEFNIRKRYFLRLGIMKCGNSADYLSDGYVERYEQSMPNNQEEEAVVENIPESFMMAEPELRSTFKSPMSMPSSSCKLKTENEVEILSNSCLSFQGKQKTTKITTNDVKIQGRIGSGNFGKIFAVKLKDNQELFAMKTYGKQEFLLTNLARFLFSEKRIMANFDHPFIVKMHYAFQNNEKLFIMMDYCHKGDLGNQTTRLNNLQLKVLTCELILAIKALHDQDIIHRDLKPNNVFISRDGHIKLGDFGLAKENVRKGSLNYTFCGSVAYLPPEIINKEGHNKTIDWYLLGELLYEVVVGTPPYYAQSKEELYHNIRNKVVDMASLTISDSLKDLISRLIKRDPAERLGARYGPSEIMSHRYFAGIDWQRVYDKKYHLFDPSSIHSYKLKPSLSDDPFKDSPNDSLNLPHWSFTRR